MSGQYGANLDRASASSIGAVRAGQRTGIRRRSTHSEAGRSSYPADRRSVDVRASNRKDLLVEAS